MSWFDDILPVENRREIEAAVEELNSIIIQATMLCGNITDFIDARFNGSA